MRFTFERWLLRGLHYRLFFAAAIVAFVAISAGALVLMLDPNFEEPGEAVWWSFLRLTDPGYLGDDKGMVRRSISTVVTVLGYIVFLGLLIAILTQWMNALILRVESGITRWHSKTIFLFWVGATGRLPSFLSCWKPGDVFHASWRIAALTASALWFSLSTWMWN